MSAVPQQVIARLRLQPYDDQLNSCLTDVQPQKLPTCLSSEVLRGADADLGASHHVIVSKKAVIFTFA